MNQELLIRIRAFFEGAQVAKGGLKELQIEVVRLREEVKRLDTALKMQSQVMANHSTSTKQAAEGVRELDKKNKLALQTLFETGPAWKDVNAIMGEHGEVVKRIQSAETLLDGNIVKTTRTLEAHGDGWRAVTPKMQGAENSLRSLLSKFTMFRWALVNVMMAVALLKTVGKLVEWANEVEDAMYKVSAVTKQSVESVTDSLYSRDTFTTVNKSDAIELQVTMTAKLINEV